MQQKGGSDAARTKTEGDMATDKKVYYWLKMKDDFLSPMGEDQTMAYLMDMDDGYGLVVTYIAFLLASLKGDGRLTRYVGDDIIRHDARSLARATGMDAGLVKKAIPIFEQLGLIEWSPAGEVVMCRIGEMIGSETQEAVYKRRQRAKTKAAGQCPDDVQVSNGQCLDNVQSRLDNVQQMSSRDKSKSKSKSVEEPEKPSFPDDDDLPFANVSDDERIQQGLVQVAGEWNRITDILKKEGIKASSLVLSQMKETSDRTRRLRLAVRDYGADVIVRCLRAYEQDDWWTGRTSNPKYAGKSRDIIYVLDNFEKLLRLADEMGLIEAADSTGGVRYRPTEQSADVSPDQTQQTRQPRSRALRNRR